MSLGLFFYGSGDHRDLHVLTHSFPTRRSSDLADSAAAARRLDENGKADAPGFREDMLFPVQHARGRADRHAVLGDELARAGLVAHRRNPFRRRADEAGARRLDPLGEFGVLRAEAVAGMDAVRPGFPHDIEQGVLIEVARTEEQTAGLQSIMSIT